MIAKYNPNSNLNIPDKSGQIGINGRELNYYRFKVFNIIFYK